MAGWAAYIAQFDKPVSRKTPLADIPFVVLDTETTGLNPRRDRMLSIGAVGVTGWTIPVADRFEAFVGQTQGKADANSIAVHGILPTDHMAGKPEDEVVSDLLAFLGNRVVVGHHVAFDWSILQAAVRRHGGGRLRNPVLDTYQLALRLRFDPTPPGEKELGLDQLANTYRIPPLDRHTAAGDAWITAQLLLKLMGGLALRGTKTFGDLQRRKRSIW